MVMRPETNGCTNRFAGAHVEDVPAEPVAGKLVKGKVREGKIELSYRLGDRWLVRQRVDPASPASRSAFIKALRQEFVGIDEQQEADIASQLMQLDADAHDPEQGRDGPGSPLVFREEEPWPDVVNGENLIHEIADTLRRFVVLPDGAVEAAALWCVSTYAFDVFLHSPRLAVVSPVMRCGKSTVLRLLGCLVAKPQAIDNATPAVLFRLIDAAAPSLLLDECDRWMADREAAAALISVINSGHRKGGTIPRCVGDSFEPRAFATFAPMALAAIGSLAATIRDRAVFIRLRRRMPGERVDRLREDRLEPELEPLRQRITRWIMDHRDELADADPDLPEQLDDRARDNWRPLIAIADLCGEWAGLGRAAATALAADRDVDEGSWAELLLSDLRDLFHARDVDRLSTTDILSALHGMEHRPWPEFGRARKPITPIGVAGLLRRFRVRPGTIRLGGDTGKGYLRERLQDAFERYLPPYAPPEPSQRHNPHGRPVPAGSEPSHPESDVTAPTARRSAPQAECDGVTAREGG